MDLGHHDAIFRNWRASTVGLVSYAQQPQAINEDVDEMAERMTSLFEYEETGKATQPSALERGIRALVKQAIDVDMKLFGQCADYIIGWLACGRFDVPFDERKMRLPLGGPQAGHTIRFMVQPFLLRSVGRGDEAVKYVVLDHCTVVMK